MKIIDIRVIVTCPSRNFVFVKIITDQQGLYGVGDVTLNGRELAVAEALDKHIAPLLIGCDPDKIEDTWQYLFRGTYWRGGPVLMTALSGIDMALWDIKGKRAGMPLYSLLGGKCREKILIYRHVFGRDFAEVEDRARQQMEEHKMKAIRVQVALPECLMPYGTRPINDKEKEIWDEAHRNQLPVETVWEPTPYLRIIPQLFDHLRNKLGEEVELLHDVHERLSPVEAIQLARVLEPYRLFFLEDPIPPEHKENFRLIRSHCSIPLAMGELFHTKWECLTLIEEQLIDFIRCDLAHVGGITEARKIAALAESHYVKTAWHGPPDISPIAHAANIHVDLAIPNFGIQEWTDHKEMVHEVCPGGPTVKEGYASISEKPGLGCDIDEKAAKKYPYKRDYLPITRGKDGSVHDW